MKTIEKTPQRDLLAIGLSLDRVVVELLSLDAVEVDALVVGAGGAPVDVVDEAVEDDVGGG